MSYSRSPSSLLRYPAAQPCFAARYLKFTRLAGIAHYITTINTNPQSDSKNKIEFKEKKYIYSMGLKSKSQANNLPSQISKTYQKSGLIFESRSAYDDLRNIDLNARQLVDAIKAGSLDMKEFFSRFDKVKVKETYAGAAENLEVLFENITRLISIKDRDYFETELDFSDYFHSKIDVEFFDD